MTSSRNPLIIGAGPAGLTAALQLAKRGAAPRVFEASSTVGGLACTPADGPWRVDTGGHRFFTKDQDVLDLWNSLLPPDQWISVRRHSAMLVEGHFVRYPLVGRDLLTQMGIGRGLRGLTSLAWARARRGMRPVDDSASFREWGTYEFGRHWYNLFFDGYVRKTWLADPDAITSDWAHQRIKPIDWLPKESDTGGPEEFRYPIRGPGQVWEAAAAALAADGVTAALNTRVVKARFDGTTWTLELHNGQTVTGDAVFSSMPLRLLVDALEPAPPKEIKAVAAALRHRALITVAVALRKHYDIPYNWVYTPGKAFRVGRIQNYGRWSGGLAPRGWKGTYLGLEYFTLPEEELWTGSDESLAAVVEEDLRALGFADAQIENTTIVRSQFAYPVYDPVRDASVVRVRDFLLRNYPSLHPIGRNGMHRYDNQDHAMLSAMHSVARYFGEEVDPWKVNSDRGYHEYGLLNR